jgi:hypothetical protein
VHEIQGDPSKEPSYEQMSTEPTPLWAAGGVTRSLPDVYNAVVRFSIGEYSNMCYIKSVSMRRKR